MTTSRQALLLLGGITLVLAAIVGIAIFGNTRPGARADILGPRRAEPGEVVEYRVSVRDTDGILRRIEFDFGDGTNTVHEAEPGTEADVEAAAELCDGPNAEDVVLPHTYERRGVFTARATVTTGGCGAPTEVVEAVRTVSVRPLRT